MKTALIGAAVLAMVVLLATVQGQDYGRGAPMEQRVDSLASQVASLTARVARLEHADGSHEATQAAMASGTGGTGAAPAAGPSSPHGGRYIIVDNIQTGPASSDASQQIAQLQGEVDQLQKTVTKKREKLAMGKGGGRGTSGTRPGGEGKGGQFGDPMTGAADVVSMYSTQLEVKRRKLEALKQQTNAGIQIIHGHEGTVIVTLQTTGDLSASLNDVQIGDSITWTGRRKSADGKSESWMISTVRKLPSSGS